MLTIKELPKYEALLTLASQYPDLDITSVEACCTFLRTATDVYRVFDIHFENYHLSMGKFTVLMLLHRENGGLTPSECAERAGVTRGTITGLLDGLEREGWLRRQAHSCDRRCLLVVLTEEGIARLDAMLPYHFRLVTQMLAGLTQDERKLLQTLLLKLRASTLAVPEATEL